MARLTRWLVLLAAAVILAPAAASAQYTLVLKNGRRMTVQAYREEGQLIKFYGIGGDISLPRDQVESILRAGETEGRSLDLRGPAQSEAADTDAKRAGAIGPDRKPGAGEGADPAALDPKAQEEKEYRQKLEEITERLKMVQDSYLNATRGNSAPDPTLLTNEDQIRARNEDLTSRLRDAQHASGPPPDAGPLKLLTPSPFTGVPPDTTEFRPSAGPPAVGPPPPPYTPKEKELSDLRSQLNQLTKERERLIEEIKQKGLETGSLFVR